MVTVRRILCPVDFSPFSTRALRQAFVLAQWFGAEVTVLYVVSGGLAPMDDGSLIPHPVEWGPLTRERLLARLRRFVEESGPPPHIAWKPDAVEGAVVPRILEAAAALPADLVVLGTHGLSGFYHLVLGSVTEKLVRRAPCPVLVVPNPPAGAVPPGDMLFRTILCPVDFSPASDAALRLAGAMARESESHLVILHSVETVSPEGEAPELGHLSVPEVRGYLEEKAREELKATLPAELAGSPPEIVAVSGSAYRRILELGKEKEAGLIVMGIQGRGPIDLLLFGSTTNHVVRTAPCPVLVVPGPKEA